MKKTGFLLIIFIFTFASCKKYEDGPTISLYSKKHRIVNIWGIEQVFETAQNGTKTDKTTAYQNYYYNYYMALTKENDYTVAYFINSIVSYEENGTWKFNSTKTNILFTNSNSNPSSIGSDWTILKLKKDELWMQTINGNNTIVEVHFKPR
ncbi:hypothetical protein BH09BAC5_BH09BAC5_09580 [soil metagenome]